MPTNTTLLLQSVSSPPRTTPRSPSYSSATNTAPTTSGTQASFQSQSRPLRSTKLRTNTQERSLARTLPFHSLKLLPLRHHQHRRSLLRRRQCSPPNLQARLNLQRQRCRPRNRKGREELPDRSQPGFHKTQRGCLQGSAKTTSRYSSEG